MNTALSICLPTYKGVLWLGECLNSILCQTHKNFEIVICNDSLNDSREIQKLVNLYHDSRIKLFQNNKNIGYPLNIKKTTQLANYNILFLMAQDDILLDNNLFKKIIEIFEKYPKVGAITRPYFWFEETIKFPIRYIKKCDKRIISHKDSRSYLVNLFETVGQLSGLVLQKDLITKDFSKEVFTAHIQPFLSILKTHKVYFMEDFSVAIRTSSSQTRFLPSIYNPSPTKTWVSMLKMVFPEDKYKNIRNVGIENITKHHIGLVQIKNYGNFKDLLNDILYRIKFNKSNLRSIKFWVYVLGVVLIPKFILRKAVDFYKNVINKKFLSQ